MLATSPRTVRLGHHSEDPMRGCEELLQGWNRKGRGPHEDQVHRALPFNRFPLQPLLFALEKLTLDLAHPVPDEEAIQVIDLMLKRPRQ